ncbi:MAG: ATP-binding protein [Bacteriovoracia bacterium]
MKRLFGEQKLRTKLLLWTMPSGILLLLLFELLSFHIASQEIANNILRDTSRASHILQSHVGQLVSSMESQFYLLSEFKPFEQYLKYEFYGLHDESALAIRDIQQMFQHVERQNEALKSISFINDAGKLLASAGDVEPPTHLKTAFNDPVWKNEITVSAPQGSPRDQKGSWLRFTKRLKISGRPSGRLIMEVYLNDLFNSIEEEIQSKGRVGYILDKNGVLVFTTKPELTGFIEENRGFLRSLNPKSDVIQTIPSDSSWITVPPYTIEDLGWLVGQIASSKETFEVTSKLQLYGAILFFFGLVITVALIVYLTGRANRSVSRILDTIDAVAQSDTDRLKYLAGLPTATQEFRQISESLVKMSEQLQQLHTLKTQQSMFDLASNVAHDLKGPVSALDMALSITLENVPEEKRRMIRGLLGDIKDISNTLLNRIRRKSEKKDQIADCSKILEEPKRIVPSTQLLWSLLDLTVSEKRLQYRSNPNVNIEAVLNDEGYGLFANVNPTEFRRVIANLIDNAVEAIETKGDVRIKIFGSDLNIVVSVTDTGKGIPAAILPKLTERGFSYGKTKGNGIGLYHAKEVLTAWGGGIYLSSKPGVGTEARIILPRADAPPWFVEKIHLTNPSTVVVLDDDPSIHQVWKSRFSQFYGTSSINLVHFTTSEQAIDWHRTKAQGLQHVLYLFDYELIGDRFNGLDLIEFLNIEKDSILVTSRDEEPEVRFNCGRLSLKLLPKSLAAFIPIGVRSQNPEIVQLEIFKKPSLGELQIGPNA